MINALLSLPPPLQGNMSTGKSQLQWSSTRAPASIPMLTFLISCVTWTSMFRLLRFSLALLLLLLVPLYSPRGWMLSFSGVTAAEGTDEVGVLDLVPVVLGVAAAEDCPDSDISSWGHCGDSKAEEEEEGKSTAIHLSCSPSCWCMAALKHNGEWALLAVPAAYPALAGDTRHCNHNEAVSSRAELSKQIPPVKGLTSFLLYY